MSPRPFIRPAATLAVFGLGASLASACGADDGARASGGAGGAFGGAAGAAAAAGAGATAQGGGAGTTTGGFSGTLNLDGGSDGSLTDKNACANQNAEATLTKKPVDIVFVIDNSGSMSAESAQVTQNVNNNFAGIIEASGIDYRVIMLAGHGTGTNTCIEAPLSGIPMGGCASPPAAPVNGQRFFHYDERISSHDAWCELLRTYNTPDPHGFAPNGWQDWLREEAFKVFVVISDDNPRCGPYDDGDNTTNTATGIATAAQFDTDLLALSPAQFGTAADRNYQFYSIVGLQDFMPNPATAPWPATAPLSTERCDPGSQSPCIGYQALSVLTGALRYPSCWADRPGGSFDVIFQAIAQGVIDGAKVDCEFEVPAPPDGEEIDFATVKVEYTPGDGSPAQTFDQVPDATMCAPGKFYIENEQKIFLCPDTCTTVQGDDAAKVGILFGCKTGPAQ